MRRISRPDLPVLLAVAALCLVVGGTSGAVAGGLVTGAQIKDGSVTGKDVKDGGLKTRDLSKKTVQQLRGSQGPAGAAGEPGWSDLEMVLETSPQVVSGTQVQLFAECPVGKVAVGGGAFWSNAVNPVTSWPGTTTVSRGWEAHGFNNAGVPDSIKLRVLCARVTS